MLRVGGVTLRSEEVEHEVSLLSEHLDAEWSPGNEKRYFPLLMDYSMDAHLVLLAVAKLRMTCALIDSGVSSHQLNEHLEQLGETAAYRPSELASDARVAAQKVDWRARPPFTRAQSDQTGRGIEGSCVIFTSGSVGRPNAVLFPWETVFDIVRGGVRFDSTAIDHEVVLNLQPLHWSVGFFHVLNAHRGNTVVTLDPLAMAASELLREICLASPTTIYLGADFARVLGKALAHYGGPLVASVSRFAVGAGTLRWEDLRPYKKFVPPEAEFVHTYGASEAVGMMAYSCRFGDVPLAGPVPLGKPRTEGAIRFVPAGDRSLVEVYASARIASGYLDPVLTRQRFVDDEDGTTWWRPGDQLRLDPKTNEFHFHGRVDHLVKISDKRVSLVEIENALRGHPSMTDAVVRVIAHRDRDRIVAFVQPAPGVTLVESEIAAFLDEVLPSASQPYLILPLAHIPYTSRHKPDSEELRIIAAKALATSSGSS
jgi:acyl-coenzyme A synthetase/AMP-(fatty) acid ligase